LFLKLKAIAQAGAAGTSVAQSVIKKKIDPKIAEKRKHEEAIKRKVESRMGEWQPLQNPDDMPKNIDLLNLPSSNKMVKQMKLEAERELEEDYLEIKEEPLVKQEPGTTLVNEVKQERITEKVVTLNSSSNKPITFKKRRIEGQQQRQRTDD
jgi:hypothetical protein